MMTIMAWLDPFLARSSVDSFLARNWFSMVFLFGSLALIFFILSLRFAWKRKYKTGMLLAVLELMNGAVSSTAWAWALKVSGKTDWSLLGIRGYTHIAVIFWCMDGVGFICLALCMGGMIKDGIAKIRA